MFNDIMYTSPILFKIGSLQESHDNLYYRIPLSSKINTITGDSRIGKSVLIELIDEYNSDDIIPYESFYNCAKLISESNCIFILIMRQEVVNLPVPQHSYLEMETTTNINEHIFKPVCEE